MKTTEHLQRIKAECERLLASPIATPRAKAGWHSTIAAIDNLSEMIDDPEYGGHTCDNDGRGCSACYQAEKSIKQILAAWPIELLTQ